MNNLFEKISKMLTDKNGSAFFYLDLQHGEWDCAGFCDDLAFMKSDTLDPLDAIYESGLIFSEDIKLFRRFAYRVRSSGADGETASMKFRLTMDGEPRWYELSVVFGSGENSSSEVAGRIHPMSEKEIMNHQILELYTNDQCPDIFTEKVEKRLTEDTQHSYAIIQFDVVKFKLVNDRYGEAAGTELLHHFLDVLEVFCGEDRIYTRLSADIFMIVTPYETTEGLITFIRSMEEALSGYKGMSYNFVFGVYIVDERDIPSRIMGDAAAMARQKVKGSAMENIGFYDSAMKISLKRRKLIEDDMKDALTNGEFKMYLQPKYSISGGDVIGAEALVRWLHPQRGMIAPNDFIPIFEQNGFVVKLDEYIWERACSLVRRQLDEGIEPVPISVNVSRVHLTGEDFIDFAERLIKKYDIPKSLLELEITETIENINANRMVREAKERGFTLLMDDFGSGYSSLNNLKSTPFDVLKIDRSFLSSFMESERGQKIISHTIAMSRDIGLDIIAEGVETKEQAAFLSSCGCDAAQGFYYSRPMPEEMFMELMERTHRGRLVNE